MPATGCRTSSSRISGSRSAPRRRPRRGHDHDDARGIGDPGDRGRRPRRRRRGCRCDRSPRGPLPPVWLRSPWLRSPWLPLALVALTLAALALVAVALATLALVAARPGRARPGAVALVAVATVALAALVLAGLAVAALLGRVAPSMPSLGLLGGPALVETARGAAGRRPPCSPSADSAGLRPELWLAGCGTGGGGDLGGPPAAPAGDLARRGLDAARALGGGLVAGGAALTLLDGGDQVALAQAGGALDAELRSRVRAVRPAPCRYRPARALRLLAARASLEVCGRRFARRGRCRPEVCSRSVSVTEILSFPRSAVSESRVRHRSPVSLPERQVVRDRVRGVNGPATSDHAAR